MLSYVNKTNSELVDKLRLAYEFFVNKIGAEPVRIFVSPTEWPTGYSEVSFKGIDVKVNWDLNFGEYVME